MTFVIIVSIVEALLHNQHYYYYNYINHCQFKLTKSCKRSVPNSTAETRKRSFNGPLQLPIITSASLVLVSKPITCVIFCYLRFPSISGMVSLVLIFSFLAFPCIRLAFPKYSIFLLCLLVFFFSSSNILVFVIISNPPPTTDKKSSCFFLPIFLFYSFLPSSLLNI